MMQRYARVCQLHCQGAAPRRSSCTTNATTIINFLKKRNYQLPSSWRPLLPPITFNNLGLSKSKNWLVVRNLATKAKHKHLPRRTNQNKAAINPPSSQVKRNTNAIQQAILKHRPRIRLYLLSFTAFISLNIFAVYVHPYDDLFFYSYPFPFALDVGQGPSMMPTMHYQGETYVRDCWSHRLIWLNWENLKNCMCSLLSEQSYTQKVSLTRPWQKGDVVTVYNPFTKYLVTKRIVGVGGDSVQVFGEYAHRYHAAMEDRANANWDSCGVQQGERFPVPFCQRLLSEREKAKNDGDHHSKPVHQTMMIVPPNHVWLEGDNALFSIDSRHYGPLPVSTLRGRVVMRLSPMTRNGYPSNGQAALLDSKRPEPFMNVDEMKDYGMRE